MIGCRGGCGAALEDEFAASDAGWSYLEIVKGWRCGACERALREAGSVVGTAAVDLVDQLPPDSRGALPKETASTILAPTVPSNPQAGRE